LKDILPKKSTIDSFSEKLHQVMDAQTDSPGRNTFLSAVSVLNIKTGMKIPAE
jgi:translation elongation factor P/translation initiation factor 5A